MAKKCETCDNWETESSTSSWGYCKYYKKDKQYTDVCDHYC